MRVLVGCEFSGVVGDAFAERGHTVLTCDFLPSESQRHDVEHYSGDVRDLFDEQWDLAIFHPPCTHLTSSGARWFANKQVEQKESLDFVWDLMQAPFERIALENPIGVISSKIRKPDQIIQPWQYGHGEVKATCLWLKNLPLLVPTDVVSGREARVHRMAPGPNRWKERSRTLTGIASAMADQWGGVCPGC